LKKMNQLEKTVLRRQTNRKTIRSKYLFSFQGPVSSGSSGFWAFAAQEITVKEKWGIISL
jgi:hypothetical protein